MFQIEAGNRDVKDPNFIKNIKVSWVTTKLKQSIPY
jgi:hypothetical protein